MAKKKISPPSDEEIDQEADAIVRRHVGMAMLAGAIPIPVLDIAASTGVQLDMLKRLAGHYQIAFDAGSSQTFVTSLTGALAGSLVGRVGASLIKLIPGVGSIVGGITQGILSGATTYAIGHLFKRLFKEKRPLEDLDVETVKDELFSYFEEGKKVAQSLNTSKGQDS